MTRSLQHVIVAQPSPHVALVTLNRPDALNALNTRMAAELRDTVREAGDPATGVRALILTGAGDRAFCAGADLKERHGMSEAAWRHQHDVFEQAAAAVASCPVPVIAAVNGIAFGGGCELALACDLIVAADTARFAQPEVLRGLMPGLGGSQRLARRVGPALAKELLYTGREMDAGEALAAHLVNRLVAREALQDAVRRLADRIADAAPLAVRSVKRAVDDGADRPLDRALEQDLVLYWQVVASADRREGVAAFAEKRRPVFRGC